MEDVVGLVYPVCSAIVLLLCGIASWLLFVRWSNDNKGLPPGPVGIPFLGYLPFLSKKLHEDFAALGERYGEVVYLTIGTKDVVVLNGFDAIKEAFVDQKDIFSGRGDSYVLRRLWNGKAPSDAGVGGILMSEGPKWEALRRFAVDHIQPDHVLERVHFETLELISVLKSAGNKPQDARSFFLPAVANMALEMTLGMRKPYHDDTFQDYLRNFVEVGNLMHQTSAIDILPLIEVFPPYRTRMMLLKEKFQEKLSIISSLIQQSSTAEHKTSFATDFQLNGVGIGEDSGVSHMFSSEELTMVVNDLWGASTEALTSTLQWAIFYMILHPDVQKAVHDELDQQLGEPKTGMISWEYKGKLTQEVHRCASVAPLGVFRRNKSETKLRGFVIPEGCLVAPNLWNVHRDAKLWKNPLAFYPHRFLEDPSAAVHLVPFSLGSRSCPFQDVASAQFFLVFANLLHRFEFNVAEGSHLPAETDYVAALTVRPKDFAFTAKRRYTQLLPDHL